MSSVGSILWTPRLEEVILFYCSQGVLCLVLSHKHMCVYIHKYTHTHTHTHTHTPHICILRSILLGILSMYVCVCRGLPWWLSGKESACNARDMSSVPELGRSPGEGNGNPLKYSCLGNLMDRRAWQPAVHRVTKELDTTKQQQHQFWATPWNMQDLSSLSRDQTCTPSLNNRPSRWVPPFSYIEMKHSCVSLPKGSYLLHL